METIEEGKAYVGERKRDTMSKRVFRLALISKKNREKRVYLSRNKSH